MGLPERSASSLDTFAGHVEHVCSVAQGAAPPPGVEAVSSSWQRSAKKYGLDPVDSKAPRILTPAELKHFREQEMLVQTDLPLAEIAFAVGFFDQGHLARHFHHLLGKTPREFRWSQR
jgi:methylphosphotriester-DNA--protein-cysteine methyltransferase